MMYFDPFLDLSFKLPSYVSILPLRTYSHCEIRLHPLRQLHKQYTGNSPSLSRPSHHKHTASHRHDDRLSRCVHYDLWQISHWTVWTKNTVWECWNGIIGMWKKWYQVLYWIWHPRNWPIRFLVYRLTWYSCVYGMSSLFTHPHILHILTLHTILQICRPC